VQPAGSVAVLQSGGPTAVVNASLVGAIRAARASGHIGIVGARFGMEGVLASRYADLARLSDTELDVLARTPGAALGSSRYLADDAETERAVGLLVDQGVRWLVAIGGNDTADSLHRLHDAARRVGAPLAVVGIPKTIDNDLPEMDHCPGYGSAARYLALAVREAAIDTAAMRRTDPIKVVEVMGRNAGWLAAAGALAREVAGDAPQVIFLPERPRSIQQMLGEVASAHRAAGWAVVVISENQRDDQGRPIAGGEPVHVDAHGHPYYESAGAHLARQVQSQLGLRARYERPGSLQRTSAAAISETDALEAELVGAEAVRLCLSGARDEMVAMQRAEGERYAISLDTVPLTLIAQQERLLPDELIAESGIDVTRAFFEYARPLIGDPLPPMFRLPD
jgi:ATP-dependent phosphofructokinase / diphosphate-dependent phosphofructokinase